MKANFAYSEAGVARSSRSATRSTIETAPLQDRQAAAESPANQEHVNEVIQRYLPLVRSIANRFNISLPPHIDADDLYSVGVTGLLAAASKYDPAQGNTFGGYASTRIRGAILDELRRQDWCTRRVRARSRKLKESINDVEQKLGRTATTAEMSEHLGVSQKEFTRWQEEMKPIRFVPIDQPVENGDPEGASLHEVIADENDVCVRDRMEKKEMIRLIVDRIQELPETPRKVLAMYYFEGMRLTEIAAVFGLTESRISQIHARAVANLREYILQARNR